MRNCTTHHNACDCREALFKTLTENLSKDVHDRMHELVDEIEGLRAENEKLKKLTTEPDHGNEYAIVCHYKNQLAQAEEFIKNLSCECDEYHGLRCGKCIYFAKKDGE